jgi:hypothetical protein
MNENQAKGEVANQIEKILVELYDSSLKNMATIESRDTDDGDRIIVLTEKGTKRYFNLNINENEPESLFDERDEEDDDDNVANQYFDDDI